MSSTPRTSIIICTCNRPESLQQTLKWMGAVRVPGDIPCELIVVDNAPSEATRRVVEACRLPGMPVLYLTEPRRGQVYARNRGIAIARGDVILFTDDDICPPENWIEGMCRPILSDAFDAVVGGIAIAPHLHRPWMKEYHRVWLASKEDFTDKNPGTLVGANMAFTKAAAVRVGGFDPETGPGTLGFGDDTLFSQKLKEAGFRIGAALDAQVVHHFDSARLGRREMLDQARKAGRSGAYVAHHWEHRDIRAPRLNLARALLRLVVYRLRWRRECRAAEGVPVWEMQLLTDVSFYRQYLRERNRQRNYTRRGLVKLTHGGAAEPQPDAGHQTLATV